MTYEIYENRGVVTAIREEESEDGSVYHSCSMGLDTFKDVKRAISLWMGMPFAGSRGAEYRFNEDCGDFTWRYTLNITRDSIEIDALAYADYEVDYSRGSEYISGPRNEIEKLFMSIQA